jgi:hypothetical protein
MRRRNIRAKRVVDFMVAFLAIVIFSPLLLLVSVLVLFDLGAPVVFWQKRTAATVEASCCTSSGPCTRRLIPRASPMAMVTTIPGSENSCAVCVSMSCPVRPGITGWAQINAALVTTEEKGALDDWYVHNASFWLDLRIALYTTFMFTGERRGEQAVHEAKLLQQTNGHSKTLKERQRAEIGDLRVTRRQSSATLPSASERAPAATDAQISSIFSPVLLVGRTWRL